LLLNYNTIKTFAATTYNIDHFSGAPQQNAIINRGAYAFVAGDTLNFTSNINATSSIGSLGSFTLTLNGNNHTINGSSSGFSLSSSAANYRFNSINLNNFLRTTGGAIYNSMGTITVNGCSFTGNRATSGTTGGGAIYNTTTSTNNITNSTFNSNTATTSGGAIFANGNTEITGGSFNNNTAGTSGGAIFNNVGDSSHNNKHLYLTNTDFTGNSSVNGGALYNSPYEYTTGIATRIIGGTFTDNTATASGGGIYNSTGQTTITGTTFITNTASLSGGAIYNTSGSPFSIDNCTFTGNSSARGGAFYDTAGSTATVTNSDFNSNVATVSGGAIYANGPITVSGSSFTDNQATTSGGAIYNTGTATITDTSFSGNSATNGSGGAIYNETGYSLSLTDTDFSNNTASDSGGAIYNNGTTTINNGTLSNNSAVFGGGIYNSAGSTLNSTNTNFSNNTATGNGGAIYNAGTAYLKADGATSLFSGNNTDIYNTGTIYLNAGNSGVITFNDAIASDSNTRNIYINSAAGSATLTNGTINFNNAVTNSSLNIANGIVNFGENISLTNDKLTFSGGTSNFINQNLNTSNDITLNGGTINLNSGNGGSSYIQDKIVGSSSGTININKAVGSNPTNGTVNFNNAVTGGVNVNLYNGTMALSKDSYINGNNLGIFGGTLNTQNSIIGTMALDKVNFGGIGNWLIDVNLANAIGDKITSTNPVIGAGSLNISGVNLLNDSNSLITNIYVADANMKNYLTTSVTEALGTLFKYKVSYDGVAGALNFLQNGVNPAVVTGDVSQTQTFLLQTAIDRQFFGNIDAFMSFPLAQRESTICCALSPYNKQYTGAACPITGNGTFSPIYSCDLNRGIWAKTFASFESIPLRNGPVVSTIEYGTLIGADSILKYLGRGFVGNTSVYVGYFGSNQNYDGVGVSQNGALVGIAENIVKGNFFLTAMASVGSSLGNSNTRWGTDNFSSLFAGLGAKGGYNFEFKNGEYIIQPNLMLAYTFTNTADYTAASGVNISTKPLNAIQVAPGVRLIKNLKNEKGQIYLIAAYVQNIMDKTNFIANDLQLPQLSIDPYFEYGVGYQRVWKERFTGFFQTLFRGGGRNGVAFQFGFRWAI